MSYIGLVDSMECLHFTIKNLYGGDIMKTFWNNADEHVNHGLWLEWNNNIKRLRNAKNKKEIAIAKHRLDTCFNILSYFFTLETLAEPLHKNGYDFKDIFAETGI